ncbi:hypothetical protein P775_08250 [Puniceibacterium antarcticum]|uniref:Uncharacterized protein n=1 Tax=Puniceibacterium antarcticum TaxID=1206336 RepID=A0A2G8RG32_9RHOB|nr:hypothetical protein [Puniceibacterium antarcticum]PIL20510.1 hypothetical protein P775_08250 [Puniceibacterium antarcticum]
MLDETPHKYFTTSRTNARPHKEGGKIAVHFAEAPKRNPETGLTSYSMIWPGLLVVDGITDPEGFAQTVADILNENAHRFFDSAKPKT